MLKVKISDRCELIFDLRDEATPAIVQVGRYTSTYGAAIDNGEVGDEGEIKLTITECEKLEHYRDDVEEAFKIVRGE